MLPPLHHHHHSLSNSTPFPSDIYPLYPNYPSMDPSAVDFRAFYPYTPNEVKHRKRTTSAQLKVLEGVFKSDTKPNATLRNELAAQLDMTARGVQVWFQNRRAKEKTKAGKAAKVVAAEKIGEYDLADFSSEICPSERDTTAPELPANDLSSHTSSPAVLSPSESHLTASSPSSWHSSPLPPSDDSAFATGLHHDGHLLRRGSLPGDVFLQSDNQSYGPPISGHMDPFARRRSVDASLHRLNANPYAPLARAKNSLLYGSRISRLSHGGGNQPSLNSNPPTRPPLPHVVTMPEQGSHQRHSSLDPRSYRFSPSGVPISPSPSPLSSVHTHHAIRNSLPDNSLYAFSSRSIAPPIPGPLPPPDYSFGVATAHSATSLTSPDSERESPDPFRGYNFRRDSIDPEDGSAGTSGSYGALSRFGSFASTNSSNTSAYYSDVGSCISDPNDLSGKHSRHNSSSSNHFLGMMSDLDVGSSSVPYKDSMPPQQNAVNAATSSYPSPSSGSTVSPGSGSPINNEIPPEKVASASSSELAFALQDKFNTTTQPSYPHYSDPPVAETGSLPPPFFYSSQASYPTQVSPMEYGLEPAADPVRSREYPLAYPSASSEMYSSDSVGFGRENCSAPPVAPMEYEPSDPYAGSGHPPNPSYSTHPSPDSSFSAYAAAPSSSAQFSGAYP